MAKPNPYEDRMFKDMPSPIIDPEAFTAKEIRDRLRKGASEVYELIRERVASGEWEKVYRQNGRKLISAYRPKR